MQCQGHVKEAHVDAIFTNIVYAGYVERRSWDVPLTKGKHQALISLETYERAQERLASKNVAPVRADLHLDIPLRGFVTCADCGCALTAGWSKGDYKKYPPTIIVTIVGVRAGVNRSGAPTWSRPWRPP
jgi:hypothetical protein